MAHIVWFYENMEEKQLSVIQRLKLSNNMQFGADADINMKLINEIFITV